MEYWQGQEAVELYWLLGENLTVVAAIKQKFHITFQSTPHGIYSILTKLTQKYESSHTCLFTSSIINILNNLHVMKEKPYRNAHNAYGQSSGDFHHR
jgi:hypothetical protein